MCCYCRQSALSGHHLYVQPPPWCLKHSSPPDPRLQQRLSNAGPRARRSCCTCLLEMHIFRLHLRASKWETLGLGSQSLFNKPPRVTLMLRKVCEPDPGTSARLRVATGHHLPAVRKAKVEGSESYADCGSQITCHIPSDVPAVQLLGVGSQKFSHGSRGDMYNNFHCRRLRIDLCVHHWER